ncbi:DUF2946 domain-containing protein [Pigmentiphaga sp. GD03639]|jgi:hypothetical protein|uniref:DUF2946 domain-containing protein n=1 Tax=unclassified Pigmentiphaga TaxID=2626614 RepID=UPI000B41D4C8|nr:MULTISPECIES: DUF2946 domain-containing protein [unclassified Pigmentiphaga]MDH2239582.1 DUF2946 domain-containing protein [Pigmentiphaga sp. GD03639]OVZ59192.1 hypothetical protein CDO46_23860 [Pigmentiphaga sp. NML030171]
MAVHASPRFVWLALLCVLWHTAMPVAHASAGPPPWLSVLCTAQGSVPAPQDPRDGDPHALAALQCPLCLAGAHAALPPPAVQAQIAPARDLGQACRPTRALPSLPIPPHLHFSSRAPPA